METDTHTHTQTHTQTHRTTTVTLAAHARRGLIMMAFLYVGSDSVVNLTVLQVKTVESEGFCSWWIFWTILNHDSEAHDISK